MKKSKKRSALVIALVVLLLATAVGYALFSRTLTISGTATAKGKWDVHFENATHSLSTGDNDVEITTTTKTNDTLNVVVDLAGPGDTAEVTVNVVNDSTSPAKLKAFNITSTNTKTSQTIEPTGGKWTAGILEMELNVNSDSFKVNQPLSAEGGTEQYKMKFTWVDKGEENSEDVDEKATFTITLDYEQVP